MVDKKKSSSAKGGAKTTSVKKTAQKKGFDWRWLIVVVLVIAAVVAGVAMNISREDETTGKIVESMDVDNGDIKINWERYQTVDVELSGDLTITESGTYHLTGSLSGGSVTIDAGVSEVRLILDNASITNTTGPAILALNAEDLVIETVGESYLENGTSVAASYDEDVDGVIYSKADLAFAGEGTLNVKSNYGDGIVGKDDVTFRSGTYNITSVDDGIRGKDSVHIADGTFTIDAAADGIKAKNEDDLGKGFVLVENGEINIVAGAKGMKASKTVMIYDGKLTIDAYDDAVHSNNYIGITGGEFSIISGDDGVHADRQLIIDGGTIDVVKSYEGLEAQAITINGGDIKVKASDDGINAGGGADSSTNNNTRGGMDAFASDENCVLTINGGNVYVNAAGDGVDSNGYIYFNGGTVAIDGPTDNGNGALDSGLSISMAGGMVIAVGSSGMAETLGSDSGVCNISVYFSSQQAAGTVITVKNSAGETILEHTAAKTFGHMAAGSEALTPGESYTIYLDGKEYQSFTISEVTTTIGNGNVNQHMMPGGGANGGTNGGQRR